MSELDDAIAMLERAVARLEAAPGLAERSDGGRAESRLLAEHEAEDLRLSELTAAIVARVDAALGRLGQVLDGEAGGGD